MRNGSSNATTATCARASNGAKKKLSDLTDSERDEVLAELAEIEADLAESYRRKVPADSPALEPVLARHREWFALMWDRPCPPAAYAGLADLYRAHPDFRTRYETLETGFCDYLTAAMKAYAKRIEASGGD
jgi:MerR family transcriptional regulator, thiopeptide resistance regulator